MTAAPEVVFNCGGWCVLLPSAGGTQQYRCASEGHARRFAETLARQLPRTPPLVRKSAPQRHAPAALPRVRVMKKSHC